MPLLWGASLAAVLMLLGCTTAGTKPVELEMPLSKKHFIVMEEPRAASPAVALAAAHRSP
jgi:hypothetical protein